MCQDALLFHGVLALPCNHPPVAWRGHPLLPPIAHRQVAKQKGDREGEGKARGEVGQLWRSMLAPLGGACMGGHRRHCMPVEIHFTA